MARRLVIRYLSLLLALCATAGVRAAEPLRFNVDGGKEPIEVRASEITTWEENRERVLLLRERVTVQTGAELIKADRAVVWVPIEKDRAKAQTRAVIYFEGNVMAVGQSRQKQNAEQAVIRFSTSATLTTTGKSKNDQNLSEIPFYHNAVAVRNAQPTPKQPPERLPREVKAGPPADGPIRTVQGKGPPRLDPVPGTPKSSEPPLFETPPMPLPPVSTRKLKIGNRSANPTFAKYMNMPNGEQIALVTGGIKLLAIFPERGNEILDVEADEVVVWQKGGKTSELVEAMRDTEGVTQGNDREVELFMSGNVIIRFGSANDPRYADGSLIEEKVMRADRVYYDVNRNKAIALDADIEMIRGGVAEPAHFRSKLIEQLSLQEFHSTDADVAASKLPADPGLNIRMRKIEFTEEKEQVRRTIFGVTIIDRYTGESDIGSVRRFKARNTFIEVGGVPVMWFPYLAGDPSDPTGPLQGLNYRNDSIFGSQYYTTWSLLEILGIKKLPGERWDLMADYLAKRGPAAGTVYDVKGDKLFGIDAPFHTYLLAYGINDHGFDILGGNRQNAWVPPGWRGRAEVRHTQDYENLSFQGQIAYLSDRNFLEQYYKYEFDAGPNQETFAYWKYQCGIGAATFLVEPNLNRPWVTEAQWLPNVQGYWLGQSFFDDRVFPRFTYNAWGSAAYANLTTFNLPASEIPSTVNPATVPTESPIQTGRVDLMQTLTMPFTLGAFRINPYVTADLAYYTKDLNGDGRGRLYGGVGTRASMPLSKLYDGVESELLNVHGIYHKMTFAGNYYNAWSNTPSSLLPQLDRFNDDATQQSVRDMTPNQQAYVQGPGGNMLFNAPLYSPYAIYSPQQYALRRLVDTRVDALDSIQVVQGEIRQRWQTKRGYPGMEHTVDYATFDLSASFFPAKDRDNFGHSVAFVEYDATWAVGDNNGFTSSGWVDPFAFGTHYWNVAGYFTRSDGTNVNIAYRSYEPVHSRLVSITLTYNFSPKYSARYSTAYDLGITNNQTNSLALTRTGTDLTWSVGFSYNALLNNFGFSFMVVPNLLASRSAMVPGGTNTFGGQNSSVFGRQ